MLLTLSFVMPIVLKLGYDPVWWGVTFVLLAEIGLVTPPFGLNLFTINGVLPQFPVMYIARASAPFLAVMLFMIGLLIAFPQIALWLPRQLY
jgi:C4-dicarboxylate transporter DctM subunit